MFFHLPVPHKAISPLRTLARAAGAAFILSTGATMAQDAQPSIKITLFEADGVVISDTIRIDQEFANTYGVSVDAPFKIGVPRQENVTPLYEPGNSPDSAMLKINYTTGTRETPIEERQLIENIQFVGMSIPMGDVEQRVATMADLLINQAIPTALKGYEGGEYLGALRRQIGDIEVVDTAGQYIDPNLGRMYLHVVGYLNPNDENSVFAVANVVGARFDLKTLDDLALTATGETIDSFRYLEK